VPLQLLLGIGQAGDEAHEPYATAGAGCAHVHVHDEHFASWSFTSARPFREAALRATIAGLPGSIIRGKGVLLLDEAPSRRTIFQMVGKRWELTPAEPWGELPAANRLVLIGLPHGIDAAVLAQRFTAALADARSA
ncbi:MAG TPA: GTP-binding protein, partial [Candidatus Competibacteraceae bacterium]|nr:GTP-binding protein [Candidatus Competibacteraceae bacterium]